MKHILFVVLLALSFTANADVVYLNEDAQFRIELRDEPCSTPAVTMHIQPQYIEHFKALRVYPKTRETLAAAGKDVVFGCWTDAPEFVLPGMFVWVNEHGVNGLNVLSNFEEQKKGVGI